MNPDEIGLLLVCQNGGFVPIYRLGPYPALEGLDRVWIETLHSDQLGAGNYWRYDPVRNRAVPLAHFNGVIVALALLEVGTLRVRVSRSNAHPMVRTLMQLTQDPPFPLVMLGSPAPFAMLALGNLIDVIGNLPCVTLTRR